MGCPGLTMVGHNAFACRSHFVEASFHLRAAMHAVKSKAGHASKAAAMAANRHGASQPVRMLSTCKAAATGGRVVFQPAAKSAPQRCPAGGAPGHAHGAPPPVAQPTMLESEHVIDDNIFFCVYMNLISFNFGLLQSMITSARAWSTKHAQNLCRLLQKFGEGAAGDIIFGCELGGYGQGFAASRVKFGDVVGEALQNAKTVSEGAYGVIYKHIAVLQDSGVFTPPSSIGVVMH